MGAVGKQLCHDLCYAVADVDDSVSGVVPSRNPNVHLDEFHPSTTSSTEVYCCIASSDSCETSKVAKEPCVRGREFQFSLRRLGALISISLNFTYTFDVDSTVQLLLQACYVQGFFFFGAHSYQGIVMVRTSLATALRDS